MYTFPDSIILKEHLSAMLGTNNSSLEIISREVFNESSTFPVEIVVCNTGTGNNINLFCKYLGGLGPNNFGHRGGVEYEAKIYESILANAPVSKIKYFGQCLIKENGDLLLVMEYLGETLRMLYSGDPDALPKAAHWVGNFHHLYEGKIPDFVKKYDKEYYSLWSERFRNLTQNSQSEFPWLISLADYFDDNIDSLIHCTQTIIHGECYPKNILLKNGSIYLVDWESAATAAGEIDLASLIEGWDNDEAEKVKATYIKARWPDENSVPEDFEKRLLLAQIYFHFWWWEENSDSFDLNESESLRKLYELTKATGVM